MGTMALSPRRLPLSVALLAAAWIASPATAAAQDSAAAHIGVEARAVGMEGAGPGGRFRLEVTFTIDEGWHFYGPGDAYEQQTVLALKEGVAGLTAGEFLPTRAPKPHKYEWDDAPRMEFAGAVTYAADIAVAADAAPGPRTLSGVAVVNLCNDTGCLPPGDVPFTLTIEIPATPAPTPVAADPAAPRPPPAAPVVPPPVAPSSVSAPPEIPEEEKGITAAFLSLAMGAGLLTILTPCVFPMLPLTVSLLTKRAQKEPKRIVANALIYGAGMFLSLAGVGLLLSVGFGVAPTQLALSPWFNLAVFAFLMLLALSLFGAFDLQLPAFLTDWAQSKAGGGGGASLFFMGMTLAFTSFSCAAPFAGSLLVAAQADLTRGIVGMSVYAATFAAPFVTLALFPGLLARLPRSGGWLNAVKVVMGFVEVAAAFKFLRAADLNWEWGVFSYGLVLSIWVACALGCALYLFGYVVLPHDTKVESIGVGRLLAAVLFLASGLYLLPGVFDRPLPAFIEGFILPDAREGSSGEIDWKRFEDDLDGAMAEARATGRPVFIDFTGVG